MDNARNKVRQFFIHKSLCINVTAKPKGCSKKMDFMDFPCFRIDKKLRLVANPVNIHLLPWDSFYWHGDVPAAIIFFHKSAV